MESLILKNANVITENEILKGQDVKVVDGKIQGVGKFNEDGVDCTDKYISAGFIDIHTHGGYGSDFMDATNEAFDNVLRFHADNGSTTVLPTTVTAPVSSILEFIERLKNYKKTHNKYAKVYGVHLEGPFLSVRNKGAQKEEFLLNPQNDDFSFILNNKDIVKTVTISPELDVDGSMTKSLTENGIIVCGGHDDGIYPEFIPAIENGLNHLTHLYCAMSEVRFKDGKRNIGLREYGLLDDNLSVEIIADNKHIPPELAKLIFKCKGKNKVAVVSDALRCAGMPADGSLYRLGKGDDESAQLFKVADGVAVLADGSRYAGSITPVHQMVKNLISAGVSVVDAFRSATSNPAKIIKATDIGRIEKGYKADLLVLDENFNIEQVYIEGKKYKN